MKSPEERADAPYGDLDQCRDFLCYPNLPDPKGFWEVNYGVYGHLTPRPYGHTALEPYQGNYRDYHVQMEERLIDLIEHHTPEGITPDIAEVVLNDFRAGVAHREVNACANYHDWMSNHPEELAAINTDERLRWMLGEALTGHATAAGLIDILKAAPSLRSVDLQVLSTPFGYRRKYIPEMRAEIRETITAHGGEYNADAPIDPDKIKLAYYSYVDHTGRRCVYAIGCTYKRHMGTIMDDNHQPISIVERHALILRTDDQTTFPQHIVEALAHAPSEPQKVIDMVKALIAYPTPEQNFIVPCSYMTYAYRPLQRELSPSARMGEAAHDLSRLG